MVVFTWAVLCRWKRPGAEDSVASWRGDVQFRVWAQTHPLQWYPPHPGQRRGAGGPGRHCCGHKHWWVGKIHNNKKTIPQKRTFRNWALIFAYMLVGGPVFKPRKHFGQCFVMSWSNQTFLSCTYIISSSGFFTAKGNLVSSIMYPQPINFRFYQDAAKFLLILGFVGERVYLCWFVCVGPVHLQACPSFLSIPWHSLQLCGALQNQGECLLVVVLSDSVQYLTVKSKLLPLAHHCHLWAWLHSLVLRLRDAEYADIYEMIWLAHFHLGVCPDQRGGDDHPGSGCRDHRGASSSACSHHHWHHLCTGKAEEPGHLLHQPTSHQRQWQALSLLLRQGEKGRMLLSTLRCVCIVCIFWVFVIWFRIVHL